MPLKIVYLLVPRVLGLVVLVFRTDLAKDAELLVVRHENAVLRRHASRIRYEPADRAWLAALARLIPRNRRAEVFPVTPATLLAWHRRLAAKKYDTSKRRKPGRPPTVPGVARLIVRPGHTHELRHECPYLGGDGPRLVRAGSTRCRRLPHPQSRIRGPVRLLVPPRITLRGGGTITRRSPYWGCVSR